ncbi:MAG TPA: hypothetical protein VJ761_14725 [Ktedonobacteraceae bacterium]|nr:hypothetical protein [Ktedonobacteraceae bacterium]
MAGTLSLGFLDTLALLGTGTLTNSGADLAAWMVCVPALAA